MISIGKIVRSQRLAKGYTQQELGHYAGVADSTISNIENGLVEEPKLPTLFAICDAMNVHINVFFIEYIICEIKND